MPNLELFEEGEFRGKIEFDSPMNSSVSRVIRRVLLHAGKSPFEKKPYLSFFQP